MGSWHAEHDALPGWLGVSGMAMPTIQARKKQHAPKSCCIHSSAMGCALQ